MALSLFPSKVGSGKLTKVSGNVQEVSSGAFDVSTEWTSDCDCQIMFLMFHTTAISGFYPYQATCNVNGVQVGEENYFMSAGNYTAAAGTYTVKTGDVVKVQYRAPVSQRTFAHAQIWAIK